MIDETRLIYTANTMNATARIPVRVYKDKIKIASFSQLQFEPDPIVLHIDKILALSEQVNIFATESFQFYGSIIHNDYSIVFGPVSRIIIDDKTLLEILFKLNQSRERILELKAYLNCISAGIEVTFFAMILCSYNSFVNETIVNVNDINGINVDIDNSDAQIVYSKLQKNIEETAYEYGDDIYNKTSTHNAYEFEKKMLYYVTNGQVDLLEQANKENPGVTVGKLAFDNVRQTKNQLICLVTLASRAAINGGLEVEQSYQLADIYIQKIEKTESFAEFSKLSKQIMMDYTSRVQALSYGEHKSPIVNRVISYISKHLCQKISVDDMAKAFNINRSYLSTRFKQDTSITISEYISKQKIIEAQRLIKYTDKTLLQISNYLDFSSQSYFQMLFKKYTGFTPNNFKNHK